MMTDYDADPVARSNSSKEMGSIPKDRVSVEDDAVHEFRNHSTLALTDGKTAAAPVVVVPEISRERHSERALGLVSSS